MKNRSASYSFLMSWRLGIWRGQQMRGFRRARGCQGITAKIIALSWCYFWHKLQWNWASIPGYHGPNWLTTIRYLQKYLNLQRCQKLTDIEQICLDMYMIPSSTRYHLHSPLCTCIWTTPPACEALPVLFGTQGTRRQRSTGRWSICPKVKKKT